MEKRLIKAGNCLMTGVGKNINSPPETIVRLSKYQDLPS